MVRKDGSRFPAEVASTIFTDEGGNEQTTIIVRDITERKQAEDALRDRERHIHALLAATQFAEPVLFGRIIDALAHAQGGGPGLSWPHLLPLVRLSWRLAPTVNT